MMGNTPSPCARHEHYDLIVRRLHNAYWWQPVFVHIVWGTKSAEESQFGRTCVNRYLTPMDKVSLLWIMPDLLTDVYSRVALIWVRTL